MASFMSNARWYLWSHHLSKFRHVEHLSVRGGGKRAVERLLRMNKLPVRRRLDLLLDKSIPFLEFSLCAGYELPGVGTIPAGGVVSGIGRIASQDCLIIAQDSTVKAGATYPISLKKSMRAAQIAIDNNLPIVTLVDSAGAFLPLQSEIFPDAHHGGRTFYNQARHIAPQISVVLGHCTAGGAYTPMMTDQAIIVEGQGAVFLGGPPLVKAALGTVLTTEELGGARLHTVNSGCTDYRTKNEKEAMLLARELCFKAMPKESLSSDSNSVNIPCPKQSLDNIAEILRDGSGSFETRKVLDGLFDGSDYMDFKPEFGRGIVASYGSIMGIPVATVITTGESALLSDPDSLTKFAHFTQICSSRKIPLLFIENSSPSVTSANNTIKSRSLALTAAARLTSVISTCQVPRLSLLIGDHRADDIFFSSGLQPDFVFSWPSARHYTNFTHPSDEKVTEKQSPDSFFDAIYGSARCWDDGIITPATTRATLARVLGIVNSRKDRQEAFSQMFWPQAPFRHYAIFQSSE